MIKVLLVDDHRVVRAGLEQLLGNVDGVTVVGSASDGSEAVDLAAELEPDVILMDLSMPKMSGVEAIRAITKARPETRIIAFTSFSDRNLILEAIDAGAIGYLLKDADPDEIVKGIRSASQGESPLAPKAAQAVLSARAKVEEVELSPREEEVLVLVASGKANKQVARRLGISEKTVKAHLSNIFHRIGVADRTQAALWAERRGLLSDRAH